MIDRSFTIEGTPVVRIAIRSGRVNVEPGETGMVRLRVDTSDPGFDIQQRIDGIEASGRGQTHATVSVPTHAEVEIETSSGDMNVSAPLARLDVSSGSGNVDFAVVERLRAKTASGRIKVNPLAPWSADDVERYRQLRNLPAHPLVAQGYRSIGCYTCTRRVGPGEDPRSGRWWGLDKSECGIHGPGI